ncbi:hypothetical protein LTR95_018551 [Oleoguttula sp. CCFEE 5521]
MAGLKMLARSKSRRGIEVEHADLKEARSSQPVSTSARLKRKASKRASISHIAVVAAFERPTVTSRSKTTGALETRPRPNTADSRPSFVRLQATDLPDLPQSLRLPVETMDVRAGADTFRFPTPSPRLPRKSGTFQAEASPLVPEKMTAPIGVALGSPTAAPPQWQRSHTVDAVPKSKAVPQAPPDYAQAWDVMGEAPQKPQLKKSKSAWKTLGGLFRSKSAFKASAEPFYKVQTGSSEPAAKPSTDRSRARVGVLDSAASSPAAVATPGSITSHHSRTPSLNRGLARFEARAEADRAAFMSNIDSKVQHTPAAYQARASILTPTKSGAYSRTPILRSSEDMFATSPPARRNVHAPGAQIHTPKLDMDIPNSEFERYSVMFEKLLEPKMSLLERRQSKRLDKLKRLNSTKLQVHDENAPTILQRSRTSPHKLYSPPVVPSNAPAISTAAAEPENTAFAKSLSVTNRARPLQRSRTAPMAASSPLTARFAPTSHVHAPSVDSLSTAYASLPATPTTVASTSLGSPIPIHAVTKPLPGSEPQEPSWNMLTPPSNTQPHPNPLASHNPLSNPKPRHLMPDSQIVQVSVARQVSVSKARRRVQEADFVVTQPLRPRVVECGRGVSGMGQMRRSTVGVLEGG